MAEFFAYKYSTSHYFFPKIIITLMIVLGAIIVIPEIIKGVKSGKFKAANRPRFFVENFDKLKFFGTIALMILYVLALEWLGFLVASLIFVFLFNVLFCGTLEKKSLLISAIISVVASVGVWYVFGVLFNVTLP